MSTISPNELKEKLAANEPVAVIDIRESWEYEEEHIEGPNIPMHEIPGRLAELEPLREQDVVLYCNTGDRSGTALAVLKQYGFNRVWSLEGGIVAWKAHKTS